MFQLMFAIITPALIVGAIAERMKYTTVLIFIACWMNILSPKPGVTRRLLQLLFLPFGEVSPNARRELHLL
jgi:hypothetical protein